MVRCRWILIAVALASCSSNIVDEEADCDLPPSIVLDGDTESELERRGIDVAATSLLVLKVADSSPLLYNPVEFPEAPTRAETDVYAELGVEYGMRALTPTDDLFVASFDREDQMLLAACWLTTPEPTADWSLLSVQPVQR